MTTISGFFSNPSLSPKYHHPSLHFRRRGVHMYNVQINLVETGSPKLKPSNITLRAYNGCPSTSHRSIPKCSSTTGWQNHANWYRSIGCTIGLQYLVGLKLHVQKFNSSLFCIHRNDFPHDKRIFTIDQLTYYEKKTLLSLDGVLPLIASSHEWITTYTEFSPGQFKPSTTGPQLW